MEDIKDLYKNRIEKYEKIQNQYRQTLNFYSILRLLVFVLGLLGAIAFYRRAHMELFIMDIIVFALIFIVVAYLHSKAIENKKRIEVLKSINESSLKRVEGNWKEFEEKGEGFLDKEHNYTNDLDIFGESSLYQWINTAVTIRGKEKIQELLSGKCFLDTDTILKRQKAIKELGDMIDFRQQYEGEALIQKQNMKNPEGLIAWGKNSKKFYTRSLLRVAFILLSIFTVSSIFLYFYNKSIPIYVAELSILINIIVLKIDKKFILTEIEAIYEHKKSLNAYVNMIELVEKTDFSSPYINDIKNKLIREKDKSSAEQLKELANITSFIYDRQNLFYMILNGFFFMDYQVMISLQRWKCKYGSNIENWIEVLASIEELNSFSLIHHDNKAWCFPELVEEDSLKVEGISIAHPLIGERAVSNDLTVGKGKDILLITGSNMSGKSTLLRTMGVNLVLAYSGAPVRASKFNCSLMKIYTCMRTGDNLEQNISSFYAEILKIKKLIEGSKANEKVFFLLDEIFKGTNSIDRHRGAQILINNLSKRNAIGLVSTHDLELADMEKTNSKVINYHFEEYYSNNEIRFDYKLRRGVSNTRNALYLMKMAGIEIE